MLKPRLDFGKRVGGLKASLPDEFVTKSQLVDSSGDNLTADNNGDIIFPVLPTGSLGDLLYHNGTNWVKTTYLQYIDYSLLLKWTWRNLYRRLQLQRVPPYIQGEYNFTTPNTEALVHFIENNFGTLFKIDYDGKIKSYSLTPSTPLMADADKNIVSGEFGTTAGTVAEGNHTHSGYASANHNHNLADLTERSYNSLTDLPVIPKGRAATIVIAPSDASDASKAGADIVLQGLSSGNTDDVLINAAINSLPTGGGKILILEGTVKIYNIINIGIDNVTLEGQGESTKIINYVYAQTPGWATMLRCWDCGSNLYINHLHFSSIANQSIVGIEIDAVSESSISNININHCHFVDLATAIVLLTNNATTTLLQNINIHDNIIESSNTLGSTGIYIYNNYTDSSALFKNIIIHDNTIESLSTYAGICIALANNVNYININNNILKNSSGSAIIAVNGSNIKITDNELLKINISSSSGILSNGNNTIISNNTITNSGINIFTGTINTIITSNIYDSLTNNGTNTVVANNIEL